MHLARYSVIVCSCDNRKLLKDIMDQLRCDDDLDLSIHRLWPRVNELTRLATLLGFGSGLCKQQMLANTTRSEQREHTMDRDRYSLLALPRTHSQLCAHPSPAPCVVAQVLACSEVPSSVT